MSNVNSSTTRQPRPNAIVLNGHPVEEVNQFTYLGSEICKDGGSDADVDYRVRKALSNVVNYLEKYCSSLPKSLNVSILKSNVVSVLLGKSSINHHQTSSPCEPLPQQLFKNIGPMLYLI